jgi:hypothetical protein
MLKNKKNKIKIKFDLKNKNKNISNFKKKPNSGGMPAKFKKKTSIKNLKKKRLLK